MTDANDTHCGIVALIGAPNAGKSTLLNALVGSKVTIVSRKVQTTRALVRGITIQGTTQIIFVDTPGIFAPKRRGDSAMVTAATTSARPPSHATATVSRISGIWPMRTSAAVGCSPYMSATGVASSRKGLSRRSPSAGSPW